MQSISDVIQGIARQRGRTDMSPLALLRPIDARTGERISHLPVESDLGQAWLALTGEPFRPHQSHALTQLRRNEPVALRAESGSVNTTLALLTYALLTPEALPAGLVLTYDEPAAQALHDLFSQINGQLPQHIRLSIALVSEKKPNPYARLVIASAEQLHTRMLRHHDRAWQLLFSRLRALLIPDIHRFAGVSGAHLADLLLRLRRVSAAHNPSSALATLATISAVNTPEAALAAALGSPWRIVQADDGDQKETIVGIWRGGATRLRDSAEIALALQRNGYFVHIACDALERAVIAPIVGDIPAISIGPEPPPSQVLIIVGYPGSPSHLRRLCRSGYNAVILVLGDLPHEQALIQRPETLLAATPADWPPAPANAYVTAQHVLCAANELPLTASEVEAWGAQEIVDRLVAAGQLVDLPDTEVCWKPGPEADDPYPEFHLLAPSGAAIHVQSEQGRQLGVLDPTIFERWTFNNAALPPGSGGLRVLARDEEHASVVLRLESNARRSYPLRRSTVQVREIRQTRSMVGGAMIGWGRVVAEEEIYGYREQVPGGQAADLALNPPLKTRWIAPACWFELHGPLQVLGQFIGWSLAAVLPLRSLAAFTDITPCYDHEQRRLYMIDSHPGGNGAAVWLYSNAEQLLPLAYDIAYACRNDALLEPLSRVDMDWLLALLGKTAVEPRRTSESSAATAHIPTPTASPSIPTPSQPYIELPPRSGRSPSPPANTPAAEPSRRTIPPQSPPVRPEPNARQPEPPAELSHRINPVAPTRSEPAAVPESPTPPAVRPNPPGRQERFSIEPPPVDRNDRPRRGVPAPTPAPEEDGPPDPAALIARLKRQREQREASLSRAAPTTAPTSQPGNGPNSSVVARFKSGDRIFCLPYGDGLVGASRVEQGRELLTVNFPDYGELEIDPAINLVRLIEADQLPDDDLL